MSESKYTKAVYERFTSEFFEGWIESLNWDDKGGKKALYRQNLLRLEAFRIYVVENYAMMALSGDHLLCETKCIDDLRNVILNYADEILVNDKSLKAQLHNNFQSLLKDLNEITLLAKNHIRKTMNHFSMSEEVGYSYNLVAFSCYREERDPKVSLLDLVFDVCDLEYDFSNEDDYILTLLKYRKLLLDASNKFDGNLRKIINSCISKIELLLGKLSVFSKNKKIKYNFNFTPVTFKLDAPDSYPPDDYRHLYLKFLDPSLLDNKTIKEWRDDSKKDNIKMWQLAFLMRYYVKCTTNAPIIDDLVKLADYHHLDYCKKDDHNIVNDYSDGSFINYMYNSRFSFMCQNSKDYTYTAMKADLSKIESIQHDTLILNYHPYQKAVEFTFNWIERKLKESKDTEDLSTVVAELNSYFQKAKDNINWCMHHQPYLMQLRYNFSCIPTKISGLRMFCPSSICRPLQFNTLQEWINKYSAKIAIVEYEAKHQEDKKELLDAKMKIEQMDRKNLEHLGLFTSVITFLVGLLSIFVGNNGSVSLTQRMEYIIALGLILVIFVCLGFFVIGSSLQKYKPWIFGCTLLGCIIIMMLIVVRTTSCKEIANEVQRVSRVDSLSFHTGSVQLGPNLDMGVQHKATKVYK